VLSEPALALTDLALGVAVVGVALALRGQPHVAGAWHRMFWWTAAAAIAGFVHHGWVAFSDVLDGPGGIVVSAMIIVAISYLLAASVHEVLGPGRRVVFWAMRLTSLAAYGGLALVGRAGIGSLVLAESATMIAVVALWAWALHRRHPLAPRVVAALGASAVAALTTLLPDAAAMAVALDPVSLYHLAQVPGIVMLAHAVTRPRPAGVVSAFSTPEMPTATTNSTLT